MNQLCYGDNLTILRNYGETESVDTWDWSEKAYVEFCAIAELLGNQKTILAVALSNAIAGNLPVAGFFG